MVDDWTIGGVLLESGMVELIKKLVGSSLEVIKDQLNGMRNEMMINNEHNGANKVDTSRQSSLMSELFFPSHDGILHRVPVGWQFSLCTVAIAYCLIGPLNYLDNRDVSVATISDGKKRLARACVVRDN